MKKNLIFILLVTCVATISGCGSTYIRKDISPTISQTRNYGFMFTNLIINETRFPTTETFPFPAAVTKVATKTIQTKVPGPPITVVKVLDENGDFAAVSKKMFELSKGGPKRIHLDPSTEYGDLSAQFKKNNIDVLIVLEMSAWGQRPSLGRTLGLAAAGVALGVPIGGGSPASYMEIIALDESGKIVFSDWGIFSGGLLASKGDVFNDSSRENMVANMVNRYLNQVVKQ